MARARGESGAGLAMFIVASLVVIAIPAVLVLHERSRPGLRIPVQAAGAEVPSSAPPTRPSVPSTGSPAAPKTGLTAPAPSPRRSPSPSPTSRPAAPSAPAVVPLEALITLPTAGFTASVQEAGRSLQLPTLELCGTTFRSEAQRADRLAVSWADTNGSGPSIEAVRYGAGGAALAYGEVVYALRHCPRTYTEESLPVLQTSLEPPNAALTALQVSFLQEVDADGVRAWVATILLFDGSYLAEVSSDFSSTSQVAYDSALEVAARESVVLTAVLSGAAPSLRALSG